MTRRVMALLLLAAVVASALWVVQTRYQARLLFLELEQLAKVRDEANTEWTRLWLEQATFADASRIEKIAREQLDMVAPETVELLVIQRER